MRFCSILDNGRQLKRLCLQIDRHSARSRSLGVNAGLGVSFSSAARSHLSILSHDFPIPASAVLHNASLVGVIHGCIPCRTGGSATGLSFTDACDTRSVMSE